ncbi:MAG: ClpX C4-type zinc finger protein [Caldilineaceae bacterium]
MTENQTTDEIHCSFCGKAESEVARLVEGIDQAFICDECIMLGAEILAEEGFGVGTGGAAGSTPPIPQRAGLPGAGGPPG